MRALIVRGGWEGHRPVACTELFRGFLEGHGFEIRTADTLEVYADRAELAAADLIVQSWTRGEFTEEQEDGLVDRVREGAGFAGWHGGVLAVGFQAWRYQFMVGGRFLVHPGDFVDYRVRFADDHPIAAGLDDVDVHTEQYYCHVDPSLTVLATSVFDGGHGYPETAWVEMPMAWVREHGAGRVFVSTLGHGPDDLAVSQTRTLTERGLLWAAGIT